MNVAGDHWSQAYRSKDADQVSWFQADPVMSMRLLTAVVPRPASVIDVGAGASVLVDRLLDARFPDVTALDVSDLALTIVRQRLAERHKEVSFIVADLLHWTPHRQWDSWHDRAVFHFLTEVVLGSLLQLLQDHRRDFRRRNLLAARFDSRITKFSDPADESYLPEMRG